LQLGLIDMKRDGELVRIVADDMGFLVIDLQEGGSRRVIDLFAVSYLEDAALQNPRPTP
jgi:hypothetical protein